MSADDSPIKSDGSKPRISNGLFYLGLVLTVGWLIGICAWWWPEASTIQNLKPNELGDFLGGTFAPIAFLWLVLGFWQQGKELRNSAEALWLQMEELRNSVDQQRDLVSATRDLRSSEKEIFEAQLAEERRASLPMITISGGGGSTMTDRERYAYRFDLSNVGRPCNQVQAIIGDRVVARKLRMNSGDQTGFQVAASRETEEEHLCSVTWIDERNIPGRRDFKLTTGPNVRSIDLVGDSLAGQ